jgi:hypothetical protein
MGNTGVVTDILRSESLYNSETFVFFAVVGFELRALSLLARHSIT